MNIYTRTGDDGTTGLIGGRRVSKANIRIEAYGTVDELNAVLGVCVAEGGGSEGKKGEESRGGITSLLEPVQNELFAVGAHLATPPNSPHASGLPALKTEWVARLEAEIDAAQAVLPQLRSFILPGGSALAARLHMARTVARRAERLVVGLHEVEPQEELLLTYLNRLSDWLFVHARLANHQDGREDVPWRK